MARRLHIIKRNTQKPRHIFQTLLHSLPKDRRLPRRSFSSASDRQDCGKPIHVPTCQPIAPRLHQTIAYRTRLISPVGLLNFLSVRVYPSDGTAHGPPSRAVQGLSQNEACRGHKKSRPAPKGGRRKSPEKCRPSYLSPDLPGRPPGAALSSLRNLLERRNVATRLAGSIIGWRV